MSTPTARLAELGIELPEPPAPAAAYQPWRRSGGLVFTAGQVPIVAGSLRATGRLGADISTEFGADLARTAAVNMLAVAKAATGSLDGLRAVKLAVFVASTVEFTEQHLVANGASELLAAVLGDDGLHARSAVGVPSLPLGSPVEVEGVFEVV